MKRANRVVYPGSFDPITLGHQDIIARAADMFNEVIVAIAVNSEKSGGLFTMEERMKFIEQDCEDLPNVTVQGFSGLLVNFLNKVGSHVIVRGLRAVSDFEYEFQMALANRRLSKTMETIFLAATNEYSYYSSTIIKEVASYGGDVSAFVSPAVEAGLKKKFKEAYGAD